MTDNVDEPNTGEELVDIEKLAIEINDIILERKKIMLQLKRQEDELQTIIKKIKKTSIQKPIISENPDLTGDPQSVRVEMKLQSDRKNKSVKIVEKQDTENKQPNASENIKTTKETEEQEKVVTEDKSKKTRRIIGNILFYTLLIGIVIGALIIKDLDKDAPKSIAGISFFTVLTGSMENVIPQDSLVITKHVDPSELKVGDDITFMANQTTTITHRIVGIIENYQKTGQRAFRTKGTMNSERDKAPVLAVNVIGKVIYHNYTLGKIRIFISENIIVIVIMLVLIWALFYVLRSIFKKDTQQIKETKTLSQQEKKTEQME